MTDKKPNSPNNQEIANTLAILPISIVADILDIKPSTLRTYDKENVLKSKRSSKNRRLYSFDDLEKGKLIQYLVKDLGLNLTSVKIVFFMLKELNIPDESRLKYICYIVDQLNNNSKIQE